MKSASFPRFFSLLLATAVLSGAAVAAADVKHEGAWPDKDKDKTVSLDVDNASRSEALKKLASASGWSIVASDLGSGTVDVHVKDQPASRVLDLLLDDGDYVAKRDDGNLVQIRRASAAAPSAAAPASPPPAPSAAPTPPTPAVPPAPPAATKAHGSGEDRTVFGSNVRIEADETVKDVTAFGGNIEVAGHVTHDLTAFGGNVHVLSGGRVEGDTTLLGGNLKLDDGAVVDGDVSLVGGQLDRAPGAKLNGNVDHKAEKHIGIGNGKIAILDEADSEKHEGFLARVGSRLTSMAILFVFGTMLLALASGRMEHMRVEIARRPMRTFALGVVSFFAAILAIVVLCVTIIGIPLAVVGTLMAVLGGYAGVAAALTTFGAAVLGHRTQNPYVHLALGCAALFVLGFVPVVSGLVTAFVAAIGIGALVTTRGAGVFAKRNMGPYRSEP